MDDMEFEMQWIYFRHSFTLDEITITEFKKIKAVAGYFNPGLFNPRFYNHESFNPGYFNVLLT